MDSVKTSVDMSALGEKPVEKASVEKVLAAYATSGHGLSAESAARRFQKFGPNEITHKKPNKLWQFISFLLNPWSYVMEFAAVIAIAVANGEGMPPDWEDFIGIVLLLLTNATIGYLEESKAGAAVEALMSSLSPVAKVKRDDKWSSIPAREVVPGDIISVKLGDIVPADAKLMESENVKVDQSGMTGDSLPVDKKVGDLIYSGSTVKQGEAEGVVVTTGSKTLFGKATALVKDEASTSHFQKVLTTIGSFCVVLILIFVVVVIVVMYPAFKYSYRRGINNILVLFIGGVPIAMPTVLSVVMSSGASALAKGKAIVTRITAVEAVDTLCSDKTGTITKNELEVAMDMVVCFGEEKAADILLLSARASRLENQDAIDHAIVSSLAEPADARKDIEELHFMPFAPTNKRTQITYLDRSSGETVRVTKGAPQAILALCCNATGYSNDRKVWLTEQVEKSIARLAESGYRALGVAKCVVPQGTTRELIPDAEWMYVGMLAIYDPPRDDSAETIKKALELGVQAKMITGDQLAIAKETGRRLGMGTNMYEASILDKAGEQKLEALTGETIGAIVEKMDGVAGVLPEHKYEVVKRLQEGAMHRTCCMTGDGINDAPALKRANVGIAVEGATDGARGAADTVLTEPGLSVIVTAILKARRIFQRMQSYALFATTTTVRIVITFSILIFAWRYDHPPFLILILALLNDGTIMTISTDRVKPSQTPEKWRFTELFSKAIALGLYLTLSTLVFFHVIFETDFFANIGLSSPWLVTKDQNDFQLHSIIYLQVSISGQALIFSTRSKRFWFTSTPSLLLICAFIIAQFIATIISVYADWGFTQVEGVGWGWAACIWVWSIVWFIPIDLPKLLVASFFRTEHPFRSVLNHRLFTYMGIHSAGRRTIDPSSITAAKERASIDARTSAHGMSIARTVASISSPDSDSKHAKLE